MTIEQLNGKIEGLATALAYLIADMETRSIIDGPCFSQHLISTADRIRSSAQTETDHFREMTLHNLAVTLDDARRARNAGRQ